MKTFLIVIIIIFLIISLVKKYWIIGGILFFLALIVYQNKAREEKEEKERIVFAQSTKDKFLEKYAQKENVQIKEFILTEKVIKIPKNTNQGYGYDILDQDFNSAIYVKFAENESWKNNKGRFLTIPDGSTEIYLRTKKGEKAHMIFAVYDAY